MIGEVVNRPVKERIYGTIAATIAISNGASVIRTHDVAATMMQLEYTVPIEMFSR